MNGVRSSEILFAAFALLIALAIEEPIRPMPMIATCSKMGSAN